MELDSIRRSADGIAVVIADIDAGKLEASADQRAYLTGALDTLDYVRSFREGSEGDAPQHAREE